MALAEGTNCGFCASAPSADPEDSANVQTVDPFAVAGKYTSPADATAVTEIGWWCDDASEEADFEVGLYTHDAGNDQPDELLDSDLAARGTGAGWKKITGLNIPVTGSTIYWIAAQSDGVLDPRVNTDSDYQAGERWARTSYGATTLENPFANSDLWDNRRIAVYAVYTTEAPSGTNTQINIGDAWKNISAIKINIGDVWKDVAGAQINIGDTWKTIF